MLVNQNVKYLSDIDHMSTIFAALGDPTRLSIMEHLSRGESTVNELAKPFKVTLPAISRHLKVLEHAGLISRKRHAQWRQCSTDANVIMEVATWAENYKKLWDSNLDNLDTYLDTLMKAEN
jgi:DNA-binding transcriptional ArsR family regulator